MKAKKSFGQHFLHDEKLAERIAHSLLLADTYGRRIVEVGPGKGMLTQYLLPHYAHVIAIEADRDMVAYLQQHYPALAVTHQDFLKYPLATVYGGESFGLIGNFPYNISSQIVFKMIEHRAHIPEMVGMFQKEMAERIVAPAGGKDYGIISVLTQAFYEGKLLFSVGKGAFSPPPNVLSAVIRLTRKDTPLGCDEAFFRTVVKTAFGQRRKMMRNTLASLVQDSALLLDPIFTKRPEQLTVPDFVNLTNRLQPNR